MGNLLQLFLCLRHEDEREFSLKSTLRSNIDGPHELLHRDAILRDVFVPEEGACSGSLDSKRSTTSAPPIVHQRSKCSFSHFWHPSKFPNPLKLGVPERAQGLTRNLTDASAQSPRCASTGEITRWKCTRVTLAGAV